MRIDKRYFLSLLLTFFIGLGVSQAQNIKVSGVVSDSTSGEPLPGVNIRVQGSQIGTSSDADGQYTLTVPKANSTLIFSFVGYQAKTVPIRSRESIDVSLAPSISQLSNIVVVGYGTQKQKDVTGSVSQISGEEISNVPTSSALNGLQGKVAGVTITAASGAPNAQPTVRIRGVGTLNNAAPLYVVDGTLTNDISFLSPSDIKSVSVLKDASAEAIYGSRGANGVIIVTTKQGKAGKLDLSAHAYFGLQRVANKIDMTNASEYAQLVNESLTNGGNDPQFDNPSSLGAGTDYQDFIFDDAAPKQSYGLSASGGTDDYLYSVSANYYNQDGVVRGSNYQRVSLRLNNKYFLSDHVEVGHNIALKYSDNDNAAGSLVYEALKADPTLPPFDDDGKLNDTSVNGGDGNPAALIKYNNNHDFGYRTVGNAYLKVDFLKNLELKSSFNLDFDRINHRDFNPEFFVSPIQQVLHNNLTVNDNNHTNWYARNTLRYENTWANHHLKLLGGLIFQQTRYERLGGSRMNFPGSAPNLFYLDAGQTEGQTNFNSSSSSGKVSYLARANYSYMDRYLLTATFRADGSSKFGENNRYGYFPSVAVGWRVDEEPFFNISSVSNLKFRASYGSVGNDNIDANAAIPLVSSGLTYVLGQGQQVVPGATITDLANPDLKWEVTKSFNAGIDVGLFNSQVNATVEYYHKKTSDILVTVPIPPHVGAGAPVVNAASVLNRGFDVSVSWQHNSGDFNYKIGLNGSTVHNEVTSLGENQNRILAGARNNLGNTTRTAVGHSIGAFYGYKIIGVIQNAQDLKNNPTLGGEKVGDNKFADLNGFDDDGNLTGKPDGVINSADKTYLGSPIPDFTVGLNLSMGYKNFDINASFNSQFGNQILNARRSARGFRLLNYPSRFLDRWHGQGTSNFEPRLTEGSNYHVGQFLQDGDFVRLHNIQLGYTLPVGAATKLNVSKVRFYVNAENPFIITNYTGYSPEISNDNVIASGIDDTPYPTASTYTFGIQLDF